MAGLSPEPRVDESSPLQETTNNILFPSMCWLILISDHMRPRAVSIFPAMASSASQWDTSTRKPPCDHDHLSPNLWRVYFPAVGRKNGFVNHSDSAKLASCWSTCCIVTECDCHPIHFASACACVFPFLHRRHHACTMNALADRDSRAALEISKINNACLMVGGETHEAGVASDRCPVFIYIADGSFDAVSAEYLNFRVVWTESLRPPS